ncbi:hypothetical protein [Pandoraea apista]|uniref:hypothetical protein n=1 Tax=Pandoraea apista TaxID=93218 RepID=UPI000B8BBFDE|nr:hypothetical protein [Pandoraea apista]OXS92671.1 hypothetical protein B7H01_17190 [Pandoraea apista]
MPDLKTVTFDASQWQLVPKEPTQDMVTAGFESEPDEAFSEPKVWEAFEKLSGCQQAAHKATLCYRAMLEHAPTPAAQSAGQEAVAWPILKGVGKIDGDGWKDTTKVGQIVYVWNAELPAPNMEGQFPRIGNEIWSASTKQYDFTPATMEEIRDFFTTHFASVNGGEREAAYEPYSASDFTKLVAENAGLKLDVQRLEKQLLELNEELHVADLEREHFGDPDKRTGIYAQRAADAPQVGGEWSIEKSSPDIAHIIDATGKRISPCYPAEAAAIVAAPVTGCFRTSINRNILPRIES